MMPSRIATRHKHTIDHIHRIRGQMETLKQYVLENKGCAEIAQLTTSVAKSFDALRVRTLEGFIRNDLLGGKNLSSGQSNKLERVLKLYKR